MIKYMELDFWSYFEKHRKIKLLPFEKQPPIEIPVDLIEPDPFQPRTVFEEEKIKELANSIKEQGLLQPIQVRLAGKKFVIIDGERRWRAFKLLGYKTIPAFVLDVDERKARILAFIQNMQRVELSEYEKAKAIRNILFDDKGNRVMSIAELAKETGFSERYIRGLLLSINPEYVSSTLQEAMRRHYEELRKQEEAKKRSDTPPPAPSREKEEDTETQALKLPMAYTIRIAWFTKKLPPQERFVMQERIARVVYEAKLTTEELTELLKLIRKGYTPEEAGQRVLMARGQKKVAELIPEKPAGIPQQTTFIKGETVCLWLEQAILDALKNYMTKNRIATREEALKQIIKSFLTVSTPDGVKS